MPISQIVTNSIANSSVTLAKFASTTNIVKPSITSPANAATAILDTQLFTASPYLSLYGRSQANAQWEISTSPSFAFLNVSSTINGSNTQFQANSSSGITANTVHYIRVRYSDDGNNSSEYSDTVQFTTNTAFPFIVNYLVVAGGGGAGGGLGSQPYASAGGGAGGYRSSVPGFSSGANSPAESGALIFVSTNYTVTVGGGGAVSTRGSNSVFSSVSSRGGGAGAPAGGGGVDSNGGSGGGAGDPVGTGGLPAGTGEPGQGTSGGSAPSGQGSSGGGGGAGAAGSGNQGGNGLDSPITGTPVTRGGGGSGGTGSTTPGGSGGGGASGSPGGPAGPATAGTPNTGGGGGGARGPSSSDQAGKTGGSGTVILRYPNTRTISNPGGGLTFTTSANGSNTVAIFTAGTGSVSWS